MGLCGKIEFTRQLVVTRRVGGAADERAVPVTGAAVRGGTRHTPRSIAPLLVIEKLKVGQPIGHRGGDVHLQPQRQGR